MGALSLKDAAALAESLGECGRFKVRIRGDSMDGPYGPRGVHLPCGTWVLLERPRPRSDGVKYGRLYLVWVSSGETTFRQVVKCPERPRDYLILRSLHPDRRRFPDQPVHRRDVLYLSRAVAVEMEL